MESNLDVEEDAVVVVVVRHRPLHHLPNIQTHRPLEHHHTPDAQINKSYNVSGRYC